MSKFLGMTDNDITALKGKALTDIASEMQIPGRSKMKADELRAAIRNEVDELRRDQANGLIDLDSTLTEGVPAPIEPVWETVATIPAESNDIIQAPEVEKWEVVPNRKARREAARRQRKARGRIAQKQNKNN